ADAEQADADETKHWVEAAGQVAAPHPVDLSRPEQCQRLVRDVGERFGRIDILVNNAAFQGKAVQRFEELTPERVRYTFATNIEAMFTVTREALGYMSAGATIINTTSIQGVDPSPGLLDYASTKAAITNFTKGLAKELIDRGIRVNGVAPGPVWT